MGVARYLNRLPVAEMAAWPWGSGVLSRVASGDSISRRLPCPTSTPLAFDIRFALTHKLIGRDARSRPYRRSATTGRSGLPAKPSAHWPVAVSLSSSCRTRCVRALALKKAKREGAPNPFRDGISGPPRSSNLRPPRKPAQSVMLVVSPIPRGFPQQIFPPFARPDSELPFANVPDHALQS